MVKAVEIKDSHGTFLATIIKCVNVSPNRNGTRLLNITEKSWRLQMEMIATSGDPETGHININVTAAEFVHL